MDVSITVIIPVYNVEKYLVQCLESIVGQSVLFDEVILVNDGSSDKSLSICMEYCSNYKYFKLINQNNQGLSAARNKGLECASKEYVMFLDSDDYLRMDTVKLLKDKLCKFPMDAVYFDADIRCEDGCTDRKNIYERKSACLDRTLMSGWEFFSKCYPENYVVSACMAVYRKKAIDDAGAVFPEGLYYEDNFFSYIFMIQAKYVSHISEKLYQRRYRKGSITTSANSEKKIMDFIKIILLIWNEIICMKDMESPEKKRILWRFIDDYCGLAIGRYGLCLKQNILTGSDVRDFFCDMAKKYELLLRKYPLDDEEENLFLLNRILRNLCQIDRYCPEERISIRQAIEKMEEKQDGIYQTLLCGLPLNSERHKVGIYGTGKYTEGLLSIYEKVIGNISCDLVFIDSYRKNGLYKKRKVINYREVDDSFDMVVISSFLYRKEMIENIKSVNKKVFLYDFFEIIKEDVFSGYDSIPLFQK